MVETLDATRDDNRGTLHTLAGDMPEALLDHVTGGGPSSTTISAPGTSKAPQLLPSIAIIAILIG
jgi:hypothetical protein